jgi:hypothetical protein
MQVRIPKTNLLHVLQSRAAFDCSTLYWWMTEVSVNGELDFVFSTYAEELKRFKREKLNAKRITGTIGLVSLGEEHKKHGLFFKLTKSPRVLCVCRDHPNWAQFERVVVKGAQVDLVLFPANATIILYVLDFQKSSTTTNAIIGTPLSTLFLFYFSFSLVFSSCDSISSSSDVEAWLRWAAVLWVRSWPQPSHCLTGLSPPLV